MLAADVPARRVARRRQRAEQTHGGDEQRGEPARAHLGAATPPGAREHDRERQPGRREPGEPHDAGEADLAARERGGGGAQRHRVERRRELRVLRREVGPHRRQLAGDQQADQHGEAERPGGERRRRRGARRDRPCEQRRADRDRAGIAGRHRGEVPATAVRAKRRDHREVRQRRQPQQRVDRARGQPLADDRRALADARRDEQLPAAAAAVVGDAAHAEQREHDELEHPGQQRAGELALEQVAERRGPPRVGHLADQRRERDALHDQEQPADDVDDRRAQRDDELAASDPQRRHRRASLREVPADTSVPFTHPRAWPGPGFLIAPSSARPPRRSAGAARSRA